ncbi:hypothetical protein [Halorubrum sp. CSM-61]|uniref:hypothetical protein n=1 Tax=Halorubrum sp. CSM-61 TaxID=2485838 RepID=UPI000F4BBA37|nr:hypothetical protein [Halorubrum sp. CSM-61]
MPSSDDQLGDALSRRGALAVGASIVTAGCTSIGSAATPDSEQRRPQARVSGGYYTGQRVSTETYEAIPGEFVQQVSVELETAESAVERVEFLVFADPTPVTTAWSVPEQIGEERNLGENAYGETVHDGEATFEAGTPWEVRACGDGESWTVDEGEIPEVDDAE